MLHRLNVGRITCLWKRHLVFRRNRTTGHPECRERPKNPFYDPLHEVSIHGRQPRCYYGKKHLVTMAKGVGVGPELMEMVKRVFHAANAPVEFEELDMAGNENQDEEAENQDEMENLIYSVERNGVCIKGNIEKALEPREISRNMMLRRALDLYVNLIEIKSYGAIVEKTRTQRSVDVVLVRQNIEGEFSMLEHENGNGIEHMKITTEYNTRRLAEFAFDYAVKYNRRQVVCIFNKGFMRYSESLFVDVISQVASRYPEIPFKTQSMRSFAFNMSKFGYNGDVLITGVLYGGIIMSLLFGLMYGSGLFCGQNLGSRYAVFEPAARNKGFKLAGKDMVNPVAALMSGVQLLDYLGHKTTAHRIKTAIALTINDDHVYTKDLFGGASTTEMVRNIERRIRETMPDGYREESLPPLPPMPPPTRPFSKR